MLLNKRKLPQQQDRGIFSLSFYQALQIGNRQIIYYKIPDNTSEFINDPKNVVVLQVLLLGIRDNYLNSKIVGYSTYLLSRYSKW